jgi:UDP-N-acetylmuramoylalanine--D-glutamate ligase
MNKKKIGIFGLGISGLACYKYLVNKASHIICFDDSQVSIDKFIEIYGSNNLKNIDDKAWLDLDFIIISPGIPTKHPKPHKIVDIATQNNIEIISDIDILYLDNISKKFIGITGTNGKSTIASLIHHIIKDSGLNYALCGNIGVCALSLEDKYDGYIIELSSFQLELIKYLKLDVAIISNITPDHLDRYENLEHYIKTKIKIFDFCNGPKIIAPDNNLIRDIDLIEYDQIYKIFKSDEQYLVQNESNIIIKFNKDSFSNRLIIQNYIFSYLVANILGISKEEIIKSANNFLPLKHRMEFVGNYNNINFYNDSKATNVDAAIASISTLKNIFLLAGGISKQSGYNKLTQYFTHIKKAYLFGQSKYEIANFLKGKLDFTLCEDLQTALLLAIKDALLEKTANILLAPMCSSFDQFKNFQERGNKFIEIFEQIKKYEYID